MSASTRRSAAAAVCLLACGSAIAQTIPPFTAMPAKAALLDEEPRAWGAAAELDTAIRKSGFLLADPAASKYLQSMMDSLYPEFAGGIRVRAVNDPELNAFALPNGSVYVHLGLLALAENASQLAAVLAHEGAHFVHRHGYQQQTSAKSSMLFANGAVLLFGGVGLLAGVAAASSLAGFSRDHEREADRVGFERCAKAGYDVTQAVRLFERMAAHAKANESKESYFFASHPRMEERIESYRQLVDERAAAASPAQRESDFDRVTSPLRTLWLESALAAGRYKSLIHVLTQPQADAQFGPQASYFLGEAYRLRQEEGDAERAQQAFRRGIAAAPTFAPSYRGLGIALMKAGDRTAAREMLQRYLAHAPSPTDEAYVKQYLEQLEKQP